MGKTATALTIAGSDSGGGAGIQADLKTFSALGVFGTSALTAITAQNTLGVTAIAPVPDDIIAAQIKAVLDDIGADAVKIGMLGTADVVQTVALALAQYTGPVVLDPVMVAKSGDPLLADDAIAALRAHLLPRADLLTPNLPEAARLLDTDVARSAEEVAAQGHALLALGAKAVLMKGGHAEGPLCIDRLITAQTITDLCAPRIATRNTHGTGCTLSSAIAAHLARGLPLTEATRRAHDWLHQAILAADSLNIGAGHGPVHHFHGVWHGVWPHEGRV
jgi:hydroxymethylpyrimidine/phosphomethylpyrimidine kinase